MQPKAALRQRWNRIALELGLSVAEDYEVILDSGSRIEAPVLVRNFGGKAGMLLVCEYAQVKPYLAEIANAGYGFAVMTGEPDDSEAVNRSELIDVLRDWGWTGAPDRAPDWY